jgi:pyruvate kinase
MKTTIQATSKLRASQHDSLAEVPRPPLTKIIATIGPASSEPGIVRKLIDAGVSIFRLNFSHGALEDHSRRHQAIRTAAQASGRPVAVLGDLQGPKIRVGRVAGSGFEVAAGQTMFFRRGDAESASGDQPPRFACTCPTLIDDVEAGQRLLINDGAVRSLIVGKTADEIECSVTVGGLISSGKGINLPDTHLSVPAMGDRDWSNVEWALRNELDFLALSFVRTARDVVELRNGMSAMAAQCQPTDGAEPMSHCPLRIIAKIELPEAVENIETIIEVADGIM